MIQETATFNLKVANMSTAASWSRKKKAYMVSAWTAHLALHHHQTCFVRDTTLLSIGAGAGMGNHRLS